MPRPPELPIAFPVPPNASTPRPPSDFEDPPTATTPVPPVPPGQSEPWLANPFFCLSDGPPTSNCPVNPGDTPMRTTPTTLISPTTLIPVGVALNASTKPLVGAPGLFNSNTMLFP